MLLFIFLDNWLILFNSCSDYSRFLSYCRTCKTYRIALMKKIFISLNLRLDIFVFKVSLSFHFLFYLYLLLLKNSLVTLMKEPKLQKKQEEIHLLVVFVLSFTNAVIPSFNTFESSNDFMNL